MTIESKQPADPSPDQNPVPDAAPDPAAMLKSAYSSADTPVRRLMMTAFAFLGVAILVGTLWAWSAMNHIEENFTRVGEVWESTESALDIYIAALRNFWALNLAGEGRVAEARQQEREAAELFLSHVQQVREAGLVSAAEVAEIEELFAALDREVLNALSVPPPAPEAAAVQPGPATVQPEAEAAPVPAQPVATQRLTTFSLESRMRLDRLIFDVDQQADAMMTQEWKRGLESARGTLYGLFLYGMAALVFSVLCGLYVTRRILHGLDLPVQNIATSTGQLSEAARYQVKSAAEQSAAAIQIASTMRELLGSCRDMSEQSRDMVHISREAEEECHKGHTFLVNSQQGMAQIKGEVTRITEHMITLEEKSRQINSVLEIINEMASQTNLLSINATIEAAGAGEAGRRFAVVAEEIRLLAERAVESTDEIRTLIDNIQDTARTTSLVTADGARAVDRGLEDAARISENFDMLISLVTRTAEAVQSIEAVSKAQGQSVEQVSEAVASLSHIATESERHSSATLETVRNLVDTARSLEFMAGEKGSRG